MCMHLFKDCNQQHSMMKWKLKVLLRDHVFVFTKGALCVCNDKAVTI